MHSKPIPCGRRRILVSNVDATTFRKKRYNKSKIALAQTLLHFAHQAHIDLICLPSGYLITPNKSDIISLTKPILRLAKQYNIAITLGIDLTEITTFPDDPNSTRMLKAVTSGMMPCFMATYHTSLQKTILTNQRSCTPYQSTQRLAPDHIMQPRTISLNGIAFQLIQCGEIYSNVLFNESAPKAGVVCGHWSMPRLSRTLAVKGALGYSLINSEHRSGENGLHFCNDRGQNKSVYNCRHFEEGHIWANAAVWELTEKGRINKGTL